jgi:hypothetical protein
MPAPRSLALSALVLTASLATAERGVAASFKYSTLNLAGASIVAPAAANAQNQVVGHGIFNEFGLSYGFVWSGGTSTVIKTVQGFDAVNDQGIAVGQAYYGVHKAFASYDIATGTLTNVPISLCKGGRRSGCTASGINNAGEVVGTGDSKKAIGYSWANGTVQKILPPNQTESVAIAINKAGDILLANLGNFLDVKGNFTTIAVPGAISTYPVFLTDGNAVGGNFYTGSATLGFVLSGGTYKTYSPDGATNSYVTGIGPSGQIFGTFADANNVNHGFEYVNGAYYQIDAPNSTDTTISGVGPSGLIFGYYGDSQGSYGYVGTCPKKDICTQ